MITAGKVEENDMNPQRMSYVYTALKWLAAGFLCIFLITSLSGSDRTSGTSFQTMKDAVTGACDMTKMQTADNQMIKRLYGIDPGDYDGVTLSYPLTNMGAEELFLVKLKDVSQQDAVRDAVDARLVTQKNSFEGYGIDQYAMLERSIVEIRGNYALFISGDDPQKVLNAFNNAF